MRPWWPRAALLSAGGLLGLLAGRLIWRADGPARPEQAATRPARRVEIGSDRLSVPLPPRGETYDVLGWQAGLSGPAVRYDSRLYRGGKITRARGLATLKQWGVRTIISATPDDTERRLARQAGLRLVEVPFTFRTGLSSELQERFLRAVTDTENPGAIYLHCQSGCHRAGLLGVLYRMHVSGWDYHKAVTEYALLGGNVPKSHRLLQSLKRAGRSR